MEEFTAESASTEQDRTLEPAERAIAGRLRGASGPAWRAARSRLARVGDDVRIEMRTTAHAAQRYARQKPWRVAGAAAAIALLAGCLLGATLTSAYWRRRLAR
jgi:ElaB/YqjD/DUF883 family membrane-anchored ribosome-binding protein